MSRRSSFPAVVPGAMSVTLRARAGVVGWRWLGRNDPGSPAMSRREHPRIVNPVGAWGWHRGGQSTEQRQRVEVDGRGAVGESSLQQDADKAAAEPAHSVLCERRAQDVPRRGLPRVVLAERLASAGVAGGGGGGRVHGGPVLARGEAGDETLAVLRQGYGRSLPVLGPGGWVAGDGGGRERGQLRLTLGEAVFGEACVGPSLDDAAPLEEGQDTSRERWRGGVLRQPHEGGRDRVP